MNIKELRDALSHLLPDDRVLINEPMQKHTTFRVGGPVDLLIKPTSIKQLQEAVQLCKIHEVPYYIMGNGSNLLVADEGFRGAVIEICSNLSQITIRGNQITAEAGALLSKIATTALQNSLTGFEFAHGIPGTLGGAVVMNAGAYDGEMKKVLVACDVLEPAGTIRTYTKDELQLGYRTSILQQNKGIVLSATIELAQGDAEAISAYMKELMGRRRDKQPLDKPSAGSTFKRPEGHFAGKLIMDSGLKGYQLGGARVSDKHCGFVVNEGGATCQDILELIAYVQKVVYEKYQVQLEPEVKLLK